jgi:hypothetical protein
LKVVRVGTIDDVVNEKGEVLVNGSLRPDAHLFVNHGENGNGNGNRWMDLAGERVYDKMGKKEEYWSEESLERLRVVMSKPQKQS